MTDGTRAIPRLELPFERFELSCGATLLVSRRPFAPVLAIHAHVRGGPSQDPPGREGTACLAGTLVDQGTTSHDEEELAELLEPEGGEVSGDAGGVQGTIVNGRWELLVDVVSELLASPTYPADKVALQRRRLLDRLEIEKDDPRAQGGLLFRKLVYGDHWLGRAAYGSIASVRRIEARHLRAYHREHRVARRGVISLCGDVDPRAVLRRFERRLRRWSPGTPLATTPPRFPPLASRVGAFRAARQQVHLHLGHLGVTRGNPDYPALVVMDHVLGTGPGFTNRISRRLRDEQGLAYSVNANIHASAGILPGMFTATIGTSPANARTAVGGFLEEIRRIREELVSEEELHVARSFLVGSFPLGFERAARRAAYMITSELHGFPPDHLEKLLARFASVTAEEVREVARRHLRPEASCLAASGPVSRAELARILDPRAPRRGAASRSERTRVRNLRKASRAPTHSGPHPYER